MTSDKKPFKLNLGALAKGSDNEANNKSIDIKKDTIDNINDVKNSKENISAKISMNKIKLDTLPLEKENNKQSNIIKEDKVKKEDIIEIIEENQIKKDDVIEIIEENQIEEDDNIEIIEENNKIEEKKAKIEESKEDKTDESLKKHKVEEGKKILDKKEDTVSHKLDLSKMKDNKSKREEDKKEIEEEENKKEKNNKENEDFEGVEVFQNYESDFNKSKGSVLEKIKKLKDIVKPKTRIGFLLIIITVTILSIALLFLLLPEKHNLNTYKTNLKIGIGKIECSFDSKKCPKIVVKPAIIEKEPVIIEKEPVIIENISKKTIKKGVFTIEYETKFVDGEEIIIYKEENYTNIDGFNTIIEKEINIQKREKLKDYILNLQK